MIRANQFYIPLKVVSIVVRKNVAVVVSIRRRKGKKVAERSFLYFLTLVWPRTTFAECYYSSLDISSRCLVYKAKLTSRKLAISFLVTECVVLHMSVYGKKEWKKKETEWLLWCFHLISFFSFTRDITKIKYKETLK